MTSQNVYTKGNRKAIITRLGARKWTVVRGYRGEVKLSYDAQPLECSTRRLAIAHVNEWLKDARLGFCGKGQNHRDLIPETSRELSQDQLSDQ